MTIIFWSPGPPFPGVLKLILSCEGTYVEVRSKDKF